MPIRIATFGVRSAQVLPERILKFTEIPSNKCVNIGQRRWCVSQSGETQVKNDESPSVETSPAMKHPHEKPESLEILGQYYRTDSMTNVTPRILSKLGKNLHNKEHHPLNLIHQRIKNHFYSRYQNRLGNPRFTMFDNLKPVVTVHQNFDSLLVPEGLYAEPYTAQFFTDCVSGKVMFSQASVILFCQRGRGVEGGCLRRVEGCLRGGGGCTVRPHLHPLRWLLPRSLRILLECILVCNMFIKNSQIA